MKNQYKYVRADERKNMKTVITVVVDNISDNDLTGEWGLCLYIEYGDKKILTDAGSSDLFLKNLEKLGIDVEDIDLATLSHAHYDHANGMPYFFEHNRKAPFYVRDTTEANTYRRILFYNKYIGIPKNVLRDYPDRIIKVSGDAQIADGIWLIPHKTKGLDRIGKAEKMYRKTSHGWIPDDFSHEQSLVLDTDRGLVIINSCSHGGAVNIINEVRSTFPDKKVYGLIGGFHLFTKPEAAIRNVGAEINRTGIEYVCTGHCTGDGPYRILKEELGDKLTQLRCGLKIEI